MSDPFGDDDWVPSSPLTPTERWVTAGLVVAIVGLVALAWWIWR